MYPWRQTILDLFKAKVSFRRPVSSFSVRTPPPSATREVPTPLVFCSAGEWAPGARLRHSTYSSFFTAKGFTCIESNFERPLEPSISTPEDLMEHYSNELKANLRMSSSPFPPVIFASGFASLIAQTYISSNPAQGLFLISPPPSNASLYPGTLPTPLTEFNFELKFPLALMARAKEMVVIKAQSRFSESQWVDLIEVEDLAGEQALEKVEQWLDELGI
ncbi:hypothetical protein HYDPIDRAFT_24578 [Hydnomerulius pinastri MD-312]|nr:hypothetical protein HYDPIDRAFT_24578 [Hydnomerulius pinastri MD-312]